jgi:hypothetical protein
MEQKPSVGRVVHLKDGEASCAAIITKVWSDTCVNLAFFTEGGSCSPRTSVVQGTENGQWAWPVRV